MKIYNTLTRKIEEFKPQKPPEVKIYLCGPTVYDYAHLGHCRTYINSDVLIRSLTWLDYRVKAVMNITDVGHLTSNADTGEDKLEKKARAEAKNIREIADFYTTDFWQMCHELNIIRPKTITPATEYIQEMIALIKALEQKNYIYKTKDGIYFNTAKFKSYANLARLDIAGLKQGWRVDKGEKKNPTDFALWKFSPSPSSGQAQRQMEWNSPWGRGFPGWHIECSAMSLKHLGPTLDIHTGGVDHIPVHHTNEICQSEAVTGKPFVHYWFHSNFLVVEGEKMSKSLHNFFRLTDIAAKGFEPLALRYLFLTVHYRTKMNFTFKALEAAQAAYRSLKVLVASWQEDKGRTELSADKDALRQGLALKFKAAIEADLAMPQALAIVWETAKSNLPNREKLELIKDWDQVLGLDLLATKVLPEEIKALLIRRENLRKNRKWAEADALRQQIEAQGFAVLDKSV